VTENLVDVASIFGEIAQNICRRFAQCIGERQNDCTNAALAVRLELSNRERILRNWEQEARSAVEKLAKKTRKIVRISRTIANERTGIPPLSLSLT